MATDHDRYVSQGSEGDFGALVAAETSGLYRFAISLVGEQGAAEDLVSATVVRAFEHRGQYRGEAALRTWLHRILYHLVIDGAAACPAR